MLSERFDDALQFAAGAHRAQTRRGSDVPYLAHLLGVAALVIEHGGDEDQAIAALLHDAVEDQGGLAMADRIGARYGERVRRIVLECSDSTGGEKAPWEARKRAYLAGIAEKSPDALLVTTADKLHNARAILADRAAVGEAVWDRFTADRKRVLWYYGALAEALSLALPGVLSGLLAGAVAELGEHGAVAKSATRGSAPRAPRST